MGSTWPDLRRELNRIYVGTFAGPAGTFRQRTEMTKVQRDILHALKTDVPPRIYQLTPPSWRPDQHESRRPDTRPPTSQGTFPHVNRQIHRLYRSINCGTQDPRLCYGGANAGRLARKA